MDEIKTEDREERLKEYRYKVDEIFTGIFLGFLLILLGYWGLYIPRDICGNEPNPIVPDWAELLCGSLPVTIICYILMTAGALNILRRIWELWAK